MERGNDNNRGGRHRRGGGRGSGRGGGRGRGRGRGHGRGQGQGRHGNRGRGRGRGRGGGERSGPWDPTRDFVEETGRSIEKPSTEDTDAQNSLNANDDVLSIAVEGCCHGQLDVIYERLRVREQQTGKKVDLLICCGDFQSIRTAADFHSAAIPPKYRELGTFHQYYSGSKVAPILTIFIGGNHEASQPLQELHYGGWVAPNIYYLGQSGVVKFGGVRIGGLSGIYKPHDYTKGYHEFPPFDRSSVRSIYHIRNTDIYRAKCLSKERRIDIMLSHDWPVGVYQHGDSERLLRQKPFFRDEVERNCLGSPPAREVLDAVQPTYWFSAHLHVKFKATILHGGCSQENDEAAIATNSKEEDIICQPVDADSSPPPRSTQFLALDKCLPRRQYLSVLNIPRVDGQGANETPELEYDPEWLAILRKTHNLSSSSAGRQTVPDEIIQVTDEEIAEIHRLFGESRAIPHNFVMTVPPHQPHQYRLPPPYPRMGNPQTDTLLQLLGLDHVVTIPFEPMNSQEIQLSQEAAGGAADENEIDLDDEALDGDEAQDENAIDLSDEDNDDDEGKGLGADDALRDGNGISTDGAGAEKDTVKRARLE